MVTTDIDLATKNNVVNLIDILTPVVDHVYPAGWKSKIEMQ